MSYEELNGILYKMQEGKRLMPGADKDCLIQFVQDESAMGVLNRAYFLDHFGGPFVYMPSDENGFVSTADFRGYHYSRFEVVGRAVRKGSEEWAWYKLTHGYKIKNSISKSGRYYACKDGYAVLYNSDGREALIDTKRNRVAGSLILNAEEFIKYAKEYYDTDWEIYEEPEQPKTMPVNELADLFDAPIGWICKTRDGGSFPLKYIEVSPTRYAYEDKSGLTVYVMANGRYKKNGTDGRDIISCEHEQPKPEPKLPKEQKIDSGEKEYTCLKFFDATEKELRSRQQPNPEPQYKVGDWVEWCGDQYMVESAPPQSGGRYDIRSPYDELGCSVYPENITRKLKPSEIVVRIGCLSGTIKRWDSTTFHIFHGNSKFSKIHIDALDTETRNLVESLLKEINHAKVETIR